MNDNRSMRQACLYNRLSKELGLSLRRARESAGLTQTQAAEFLNKTYHRVSRIERGVDTPGAIELLILANAYRTDLNMIMGGVEILYLLESG